MKLLWLPLLATEIVVNQMDIATVIIFALKYKKFRYLMKWLKVHVLEFSWIFKLRPFEDHLQISHPEYLLKIKFLSKSIVSISVRYNQMTRLEKIGIQSISEQLMTPFEATTKFLLGFMKVKQFHLNINRDVGDFRTLFVWKYRQKMNEIRCHDAFSRRYNAAGVRFLLEDIVSDKIDLDILPFDFKYRNGFNCRELRVRHESNWVLFHDMLNSTTLETVFVHGGIDYPQTKQLNSFLKLWLTGNNTILKYFCWKLRNGIHTQSLLGGIDAKESALTFKNLKDCGLEAVQFGTIWETRRVIDNRFTTIQICNDQWSRKLVVVSIWTKEQVKWAKELKLID